MRNEATPSIATELRLLFTDKNGASYVRVTKRTWFGFVHWDEEEPGRQLSPFLEPEPAEQRRAQKGGFASMAEAWIAENPKAPVPTIK